MLLAVNANNSRTAIAVFDRTELVDCWYVSTETGRTPDELGLIMSHFLALRGLSFDRNITGVGISSVVPSITWALRQMVLRYFHFEPFVVGPGVRTGIQILIDNPKEVGADRVANAVATGELYGGPAIVVDLGTATTFDAIAESGAYVGGAIAPGLEVSADALFSTAAMLRRVELVRPRRLIGKSTVDALQSGILFGYTCLIEGMIERFRKELGTDARVVLTGGLAELMREEISGIDVLDPHLVLHGIRILFDRNTG